MSAGHNSPPRHGEVAERPPEGPGAQRPVLMATGKAVRQAKQLRTEMSLAEVRLWQRLRGRKGAERWRHQHPCGRCVLDFYNVEARLCIEVDGVAHDAGDRPQRDVSRDRWLSSQGITVVRIQAGDIMHDPDGTAQAVLDMAAAHRAARGPSVSAARCHLPVTGEEKQ